MTSAGISHPLSYKNKSEKSNPGTLRFPVEPSRAKGSFPARSKHGAGLKRWWVSRDSGRRSTGKGDPAMGSSTAPMGTAQGCSSAKGLGVPDTPF